MNIRATAIVRLWLVLPIALAALGAPADERSDYIRANYAKFEHRIPMRDGVTLFTSVYIPNDRSKTYPILLFRTPYGVGPYGADRYRGGLGPHEAYEKEGFIFVHQDVRGRFMSEGEFVHMTPHVPGKQGPEDVDESTDTYDTIEWLIEHVPCHNGNAGQYGISYPGFYAAAGAIGSHPALKAVSPQAPVASFYGDDLFHNGAYLLHHIFSFASRFRETREGLEDEWPDPIYELEYADPYAFFLQLGPLKNVNLSYFNGESAMWNIGAEHPNYDEFWQARNILPHLDNISAAVMVVGGWYDREDLFGPLMTYQSIEEKNPDTFNMLVMGPWFHGGWERSPGRRLGDADFGFDTSEYYRENVDLDFFKHFLKDGGDEWDLPEALMFETGANRWRRFDEWPPESAENRVYYLNEGGQLTAEPPAVDGYDEYVSDPKKPVPNTMTHSQRPSNDFYSEDQRFAARRPDVLTYETPVLKEDLTLAGPVRVNLFVSTSGTDGDWIVKLIDAYPGEGEKGSQQLLVRAEAFRGRFRESLGEPKPFVPGEIAEISFDLQDVLHCFKRGHRMMIHVQSSWFPFIDMNPQTFVPNIFEADAEDFAKATVRAHRSPAHPGSIRVGALKKVF